MKVKGRYYFWVSIFFILLFYVLGYPLWSIIYAIIIVIDILLQNQNNMMLKLDEISRKKQNELTHENK
jgi:hypothetical protein